jgi:hypothetical protein
MGEFLRDGPGTSNITHIENKLQKITNIPHIHHSFIYFLITFKIKENGPIAQENFERVLLIKIKKRI